MGTHSVMTVTGKLELTIKFNFLPTEVTTDKKNGWKSFTLDCGGRAVRVTLRPKHWMKLEQAVKDWPMWVAALTGTMGNPTQGTGFILNEPALQTFEKKGKDAAATPDAGGAPPDAPPVEAPLAAPTLPVAPVEKG